MPSEEQQLFNYLAENCDQLKPQKEYNKIEFTVHSGNVVKVVYKLYDKIIKNVRLDYTVEGSTLSFKSKIKFELLNDF